MAWSAQQQQQHQTNSAALDMNLPQSQQQNQPYPQQTNMNMNPQQPFSPYPPYQTGGPMQNQLSSAMYNQNYPIQPFNHKPQFQPYFPFQQSPPMISPFQQQPNNNMNNNTQPLQNFEFKQNDNNLNIMSQTQPLFKHQNNNNNLHQPPKEEEEEKVIGGDNNDDNDRMSDGTPKPRLEYSKIPLSDHNNNLWVLNGKEALNMNAQTAEENKIFGDIQSVYNEMKENNSVHVDKNTTQQNIRLHLEHKAKQKRDKNEDEKYNEYTLQPLTVYDYNIRPYYTECNEYNRYGLIRIPPVSSYPSTPPITITLDLHSVEFKDLPTFTVEDYLTQQIIFDYKTYTKCLMNDKEFGTKITVLRSRVNQLLAIDKMETKMECVTLLDELICIRQKKDALQSEIKQLFTKIYMNWRNMQSWRYNDGPHMFANDNSLYKGTTLMLYLKKVEPNKVQQQMDYNQALIDELHEIEMLIKLRNTINKEAINIYNKETVRQSIIQRQNTHLMPPGTVYYIVYLDTKSCNICQTSLCNTKERFRRRQLSNYSIYANIFVNNDENTKTKRTKITSTNKIYMDLSNFTCDIQFELEIKLLEKPISIEIEWRANSWCSSKEITKICIPITMQLIKEEYGEWIQHCNMFDSDIMIPVNRFITNEDYKRYIEPANGIRNRNISGSISYGIKIDITDEFLGKIQNEVMSVHVVKEEKEEKELIKEEEEEFLLIDEEFMSTFRQKILKLRRRYAIDESESVPLFDADISDHLYAAVHDETKQEIAIRNEMILDRVNNGHIDVSEVVRQDDIDLLPCFSFSIYSLFKPRRRLRPRKGYFDSNLKSTINPSQCKIVIQILESRNLPIRKSNNLMNNMVQPFIEVSFMGNVTRTFTSFGTNARWEQSLCIDFLAPGNGKYTPSNIQKINDCIEIDVYDEMIISSQNDDRAINSQIQRKEMRYLGSISIPFSTIYLNKNIEGFFKLNVPTILLGYIKQPQTTQISLFATLDPPLSNPHQFNQKSIDKYYESILNNDNKFVEYCMEWTQSINNKLNNYRFIEIFASNARNESELVCRYLRCVEPPMKVNPEIFIRFVSCIPFKEDIHLIPGARDVWMTNTDFMSLGSGDGEEHTNLLCCYFMWFDQQNPNSGWSTYIAMGKSMIDGNNTMYVLRRKANLKHSGNINIQNVMLYDAQHGLSYIVPQKTNNIMLDLMDISIVYNSQQIYANLQSEINPSSDQFNWEFENKQNWKPLFNNNKWKSDIYCLPSLQEPIIEYKSSPNQYYIKRQNKLEYIIEKEFDEWRDLPTKWNYAICKTLREILMRLEPLHQNGGNIPICNEDPQIFAINQIYDKMYGFPLNIKDNGSDNLMLESNENIAVSLVRSTKVHQNDDPNAEFARAVYIYQYTNKIASVWIYIASLSKH